MIPSQDSDSEIRRCDASVDENSESTSPHHGDDNLQEEEEDKVSTPSTDRADNFICQHDNSGLCSENGSPPLPKTDQSPSVRESAETLSDETAVAIARQEARHLQGPSCSLRSSFDNDGSLRGMEETALPVEAMRVEGLTCRLDGHLNRDATRYEPQDVALRRAIILSVIEEADRMIDLLRET